MSSSGISRNRLACTACTRRKVKCDKAIPCSNCIRRGVQDTCSRHDNGPSGREPPMATDASHPGERRDNIHMPSANDASGDVESLKRRIAELEREIQNGVAGLRRPPERLSMSFEKPTLPPPARTELPQPTTQLITPATSANSPPQDAEIEDAATILEFLAWGRRKNPDYSTVVSPQADVSAHRTAGDVGDARPVMSLDHIDSEAPSQLSFLQLLLPNRRQLWQLVDYHQECLLWYHGSYYAPSFRRQLDDFYDRYDGSIEHDGANLQWVALLFSILTGAITCAPAQQAQAWGFREAEQEVLSKRWFRAVTTCLNIAEYQAHHTIFSVQAIATLTISAHLLGYSNMLSVLLASAVRIAQSLGLHRLSNDVPGNLVDKETGRRAWSQLCTQDWFGIPFSESYLINLLYSRSELPRNCHDHNMVALPDSVPTITSYCRFLNAIASIMPQLQDGMTASNTPYTKYEQVLRYDKQLRTLATAGRPIFLANVPLDPSWPIYIPWARRALAISSSHKIIMIHRKFLGPSFTNPAFAFTRRTCLAASKTIIKEYKSVAEEDGPILWIHQAFSVAACIILCLDLLHREPADREYAEHKRLVEEATDILRQTRNSMIALRGAKLLSALLAEAARDQHQQGNSDAVPESPRQQQQQQPAPSKKRKAEEMDTPGAGPPASSASPTSTRSYKLQHGFDIPAFVKSFCEGATGGNDGRYASGSNPNMAESSRAGTTSRPPTSAASPSAQQQQSHPYYVQHHSSHTSHYQHQHLGGSSSSATDAHHSNGMGGSLGSINTAIGSTQDPMLRGPGHESVTGGGSSGIETMGLGGYAASGLEGGNSFEDLLYLANRDLGML